MLKAFSRLWLVVFIPLFLLILPSQYSPVVMLNEHFAKTRFVNTFKGTFFLLEQQLSRVETSKWPDYIETVAPQFGYELQLLTLPDVISLYSREDAFLAGEFVFINSEPELLLKRVAASEFVISLALDLAEYEELQRAARGPLFLIEQELKTLPSEQWQSYLNEQQHSLNAEIILVDLEQLQLSKPLINKLRQDQIVWHQKDDQELTFYKYIAPAEKVLQVDAIPAPGPSMFLLLFLLVSFVSVISIGMLLWVMPLWRDLNRLSLATAKFGDGHLDNRVKIGKSSVVTRLSETFNSMADNIQHLIDEHKVLTNSIAHDLRTPMYRLRFAIEMLDDNELSNDERADYNQTINKSLDELDHLINQTLVYSRYSRVSDITHFSAVDVSKLLSEESALFQQQHQHLIFQIKVTPFEQLPLIRADARALSRVVTNLLSNACRYATTNINLALSLEESICEICVEDDGPGIPAEMRESIFQPFKQLENNTRSTGTGHGLGLAIVNEIAKWHGGSVAIEDSALGGVKVVFRWPSNNEV